MTDLLLFDIETAPNWPVLKQLFPPKEPKPFDPASVKTGNLKDEAKIAAKIEEEEFKYVKAHENWQDKHWDDIMSSKKVLLKSSLSLVGAVGMREGIGDNRILLGTEDEESEHGLLTSLALAMGEAKAIVGWNIKGFDLPYLAFRMRANNVTAPDIMKPSGRYYKPFVIDMMEVVADYQYGNNQSLKNVAVALGFPKCPEESGRDFWKYDEDRQRRYLGWDIDALAHVLTYYPEIHNGIANF